MASEIPRVFADFLSKFTINFKSTYIDDFMFKNGFKGRFLAYFRVFSSLKRENAGLGCVAIEKRSNRGVKNPYLRI